MLVAGEDYLGMTKAIKQLYEQPKLFKSLSISASERAKRQVAKNIVVQEELGIFAND
jgi:hypothetical protein